MNQSIWNIIKGACLIIVGVVIGVMILKSCQKKKVSFPTISPPSFFKTSEDVTLGKDLDIYTMQFKGKKEPNNYGAMCVDIEGLEKTKYLLTYKIKAQDAKDGIFVTVGRDWVTRHQSDNGTYDWKVSSFEFVPQGKNIKAVFVLEAPGTVWIDTASIKVNRL